MSKYIIEVDDNEVANGCYQIVGTNNVLVSPNGLDGLKKYEEAEDTVKENPFPQLGDGYFVVCNVYGTIDPSTYENDRIDVGRMKIGNLFRTKEEAEFVERLKVLAEMKKFTEQFDANKWEGDTLHYFIYYDFMNNELDVYQNSVMCCGRFYFESEVKARNCIETVGADRIKKYYIGVE